MQKLVYGIGALLALLLAVGFVLPSKSRFVVSADIEAHQATVFALVNDMRRVSLWSSVTDVDPNARVIYSGPARGVGSTVTWDGAVAGPSSSSP